MCEMTECQGFSVGIGGQKLGLVDGEDTVHVKANAPSFKSQVF